MKSGDNTKRLKNPNLFTAATRDKRHFWQNKTYPATNEMSVFVAVDLLIILKHAVTGASTHEVIVALTGG